MAGVSITRLDGSDVQQNGAHFKRIGVVREHLRRGYKVEMLPYPSEEGKFLIRLVKPRYGKVTSAEVDSYYEVVAKNKAEAEAFIKKDGLWGGALAERIAAEIGRHGEVLAFNRMDAGTRMVDSVTGKGMSFENVKQYQNRSNNGLDVLAQIKHVDPPPPPNVGDFVAFEVKATLGALDNPPRLSKAQKDRETFVRTRLEAARNGTGSYPGLGLADTDFIKDALDAFGDGDMLFRKIGVRMDHSGALASTGGKLPMEVTAWQ